MTIIKEFETKGIRWQLKEVGGRYVVLRYSAGWLQGMISYDTMEEAETEYNRQIEYYR